MLLIRALCLRVGCSSLWSRAALACSLCVTILAINFAATASARAATCRWTISPKYDLVSIRQQLKLRAVVSGGDTNLRYSPQWSILVPSGPSISLGSGDAVSFYARQPGENLIQVAGNGCEVGLAAIFVSNPYRSRVHERLIELGLSPPVRVRDGGFGQGAKGMSSSGAVEIESSLAVFSMLLGAQELRMRYPASGLSGEDVEQDLHLGLSLNTTGRSYLTAHVLNIAKSPALPQLRGFGVGYGTLADAYRISRDWSYDAEYYWKLTGRSSNMGSRPSYSLVKLSVGYIRHLNIEGTFVEISGFREQGYSSNPDFPMFTHTGVALSIGTGL